MPRRDQGPARRASSSRTPSTTTAPDQSWARSGAAERPGVTGEGGKRPRKGGSGGGRRRPRAGPSRWRRCCTPASRVNRRLRRTKTVWTYFSYFYPRGRPIKDSVCVAQAGDMLAAPLSLFGELERPAAGALYSHIRHRRDPPRRCGRELPCGRLPSCRRRPLLRPTPGAWTAAAHAPVAALALPRGEAAEADGSLRSSPARRWLLAYTCSCGSGRPQDVARDRHPQLPERARGARVVDARHRRRSVRARRFLGTR